MKGCKSIVIKIVGVIAAVIGGLFIWGIFLGLTDDTVETMKENRTESIEEDEREEAVRTPGSDDEIGSGSFYEYEVRPDSSDGYTVLVPEYVSDYVMEDLSVDEQERLLDSIHSYTDIDVEELFETAYPISIPDTINVRDMARESSSIGLVYMFDAKVDIVGTSTFSANVQGDNSVSTITIDASFINDFRAMSNDIYNTVVIYAGLSSGTPVFIALNMELQ